MAYTAVAPSQLIFILPPFCCLSFRYAAHCVISADTHEDASDEHSAARFMQRPNQQRPDLVVTSLSYKDAVKLIVSAFALLQGRGHEASHVFS